MSGCAVTCLACWCSSSGVLSCFGEIGWSFHVGDGGPWLFGSEAGYRVSLVWYRGAVCDLLMKCGNICMWRESSTVLGAGLYTSWLEGDELRWSSAVVRSLMMTEELT